MSYMISLHARHGHYLDSSSCMSALKVHMAGGHAEIISRGLRIIPPEVEVSGNNNYY